MGMFSNRVNRSDIKEGDHIYSWRTFFIYAHHGIYIGNGLVIHFTAPPEKLTASSTSSLSSSSSAPGRGQQRTCPYYPRCGNQRPGSGVAIICLDCFIEEGSLYCYEYGVTFLFQLRAGTRTTDKSDPASTVVQRANYLFENGFGNYDLVRNNCEDFALYCKTGLLKVVDDGVGRSGQIAGFLPNNAIIVAKITGRPYVIKVPVEDVDKFLRRLYRA
ncbi:protein LEAD-SENSITIVE 1-like isoform X1 [Rhododendron vialii]|uniref:protein LEAD-SENSITIVE 1-like isoform X1 n=1 Tax=Rhododendron vialii TaxID=182163 RepID=UPI00266017DB|nr:protein LEAD-SENSITIVE 1-like isoform X1 [Rhododendron vialii]XP_058224137.1 protein LEAD-SENSITIVE 1-like isoform X1 [Rhododendron vialii]XP_058224138.1 protein LEAD-SENSITIVE 1-like isoform X1 [Rhododendron vialii]